MPNFSGIWTTSQQYQAKAQNIWPATPGAPTIGTATQASATSVSVPFTAPASAGFPAPITGYIATSTPGSLTASGADSPLVVTGLTTGTAYTFVVQATNATGTGPASAASNSVTPAVTCATYTSAGTYSWVAPAGVTSVSVVAIGAGGPGSLGVWNCCNGPFSGGGGGGGGLGYRNNYAVTPGNSYTVNISSTGSSGASEGSYFVSTANVMGRNAAPAPGQGNASVGGTFVGNGGGCGGYGGAGRNQANKAGGGGGGAGGYSGAGGTGGSYQSCTVVSVATAGAGGGGGGGGISTGACTPIGGGGGGGVGLFGSGSSGAGGTNGSGGGGGSSGTSGATQSNVGGVGGLYGGGGGGGRSTTFNNQFAGGNGGGGALRIVWPGNTRSFPSTNVGP